MTRAAAWCLACAMICGCAHRQLEVSDQEAITAGFGATFLDDGLRWKDAGEPATALNLDDARFEFKVVDGDRHDATLTRTGDRWQFDLGTGTVLHCRVDDAGNVVIDSSEDLDHKVLSRYSPAEPLLQAGMRPGDAWTGDISVTVHPLSDPSKLRHRGRLSLTHRVLGRWRVTVPAGTFDAWLLTWDYAGSVGPAQVREVSYWFVAPGVGPVAMLTRKRVTALLVYSSREDRASVLVERTALP